MAGFESGILLAQFTCGKETWSTNSRLADGTLGTFGPGALIEAGRHLRLRMTDEVRGAWLTLVVLADDTGAAQLRYDYTHRLAWTWHARFRDALLEELETHPRAPEHVPAWWERLHDPAVDATAA